jgi:PAS domain S-box-containing protein
VSVSPPPPETDGLTIVACPDDAILCTDREGVVTGWNAAAERLFGYEAREAIGRHVGFLVPAADALPDAEMRERVLRGVPMHRVEAQRRGATASS